MCFMSFNYRVGTEIYNYEFAGEQRSERIYSIVEVIYEDGKPVSHSLKREDLKDYVNKLSFHESYDELKGTYDLIGKAFEKPVLDLDNFPNEFKNPKESNHE